MPNMNLIRPADAEECMGMWTLALDDESKNTPSIFTLSRQPVPLLTGTDRTKVKLGAYVIHGAEHSKPDITIIATGAEVYRAIETAELLGKNRKVRVVSMPSQRHFDLQSAEYKRETLRTSDSLVVAVEAWASYGWAKYAHASVSMHTFVSGSCQLDRADKQGHSAPQKQLYEHFGFEPSNMAKLIGDWAASWESQNRLPGLGEFAELLLDRAGHA